MGHPGARRRAAGLRLATRDLEAQHFSRIVLGIIDADQVCGRCQGRSVGPGVVGIGIEHEGDRQALCDVCLSKVDPRHAAILMFLTESYRLVEEGRECLFLIKAFARRMKAWRFAARTFRDSNGRSQDD